MKSPPWHTLVRVKEELRSGELSLAEFAADLHEVTLAQGKRPVYEDPRKFLGLTYPTLSLRELVKDVAERLDGRSSKAVRQLELTYGGGKTHTLITLYHLFRDPGTVADLSTFNEFREHVGAELQQAYIVALCFDKIDVEKGIEGVQGPNGETRDFRHPWSALAFQLAGAEGLRTLHAEGKDEERETSPAEPLLAKLIAMPQERGLSTLILADEVLMYARGKAGLDKVWSDRIVDFFQSLTQAVVKVDRAALVVSLLASDPRKQDRLGNRMLSELSDILRRQREEGVQPVQREDVAEVLRRRFFENDSLPNAEDTRTHVIGVVRELVKSGAATKRDRVEYEKRFVDSFPFHPDLTDVFYTRWTQLDGFQRTRGILRTLATALRDAESWDASPVAGPSLLLAEPSQTGVSEAIRELAGVAGQDGGEGPSTDWVPLLEKELATARKAQQEVAVLERGREVEQAVITVFLHSQPIGHKAGTPELRRMICAGGADRIALEIGLRQWRDQSWFLDDEDAGYRGDQSLPKSWRLGNRPNLRQMHYEACRNRVTDDDVDNELLEAVRKAKNALSEGAVAAGTTLHRLPSSPRDISDDGNFHYAILGPEAASESGKPSAVARRFIDETTGPDRPRVYRNAVVLATPSRIDIEAARSAVRSWLGWQDVDAQLRKQTVDPARENQLKSRLQDAKQRVPGAVRQAYSIVVTVNEDNQIHAFKLPPSDRPLFLEIKNDARTRILEEMDAEALLPGGLYNLWREDDKPRLAKDLVALFGRAPRLPKLLNPSIVFDTILQGVQRGLFVARLARPDGSARTWWREVIGDEDLGDGREKSQLEVVLPANAELSRISRNLLAAPVVDTEGVSSASEDNLTEKGLPGLWGKDRRLPVGDLLEYFSGSHVVRIPKAGYEEVVEIPKCPKEAVFQAIEEAVQEGTIWLVNGPASVWKEPPSYGALDEDGELWPPPDRLASQDLSEENLPDAWQDGRANGTILHRALWKKRNSNLPWMLVRETIQRAMGTGWLELVEGSIDDCTFDQAGSLVLQRPSQATVDPPPPPPVPPVTPTVPPETVEVEGHHIQDLADQIDNLMKAGAGHDLRCYFGASLKAGTPDDVREAVDKILADAVPGLRTGSS